MTFGLHGEVRMQAKAVMKDLPSRSLHDCSQSTKDRLVALQHEIIAALPTNPTYYLLVQTVNETRNNF